MKCTSDNEKSTKHFQVIEFIRAHNIKRNLLTLNHHQWHATRL